MIIHAFDLAVVNSWLDYRREKACQGIPHEYTLDLSALQNATSSRSPCAGSEATSSKEKRKPKLVPKPTTARGSGRESPCWTTTALTWWTTCHIPMNGKKQPGVNCHSALGRHMFSVASARDTTASFHKETASRQPIGNDSELQTGIPQQ